MFLLIKAILRKLNKSKTTPYDHNCAKYFQMQILHNKHVSYGFICNHKISEYFNVKLHLINTRRKLY